VEEAEAAADNQAMVLNHKPDSGTAKVLGFSDCIRSCAIGCVS